MATPKVAVLDNTAGSQGLYVNGHLVASRTGEFTAGQVLDVLVPYLGFDLRLERRPGLAAMPALYPLG